MTQKAKPWMAALLRWLGMFISLVYQDSGGAMHHVCVCAEEADGSLHCDLAGPSYRPLLTCSFGKFIHKLGFRGPARGIIWALRAQSWKKSLKMSSREAPGPKKSKTQSKRSQNRHVFNYFDSLSTPFSTSGAPRELIFGLFFQLWARRAQTTPVAGKSFRKPQVTLGNLDGWARSDLSWLSAAFKSLHG